MLTHRQYTEIEGKEHHLFFILSLEKFSFLSARWKYNSTSLSAWLRLCDNSNKSHTTIFGRWQWPISAHQSTMLQNLLFMFMERVKKTKLFTHLRSCYIYILNEMCCVCVCLIFVENHLHVYKYITFLQPHCTHQLKTSTVRIPVAAQTLPNIRSMQIYI